MRRRRSSSSGTTGRADRDRDFASHRLEICSWVRYRGKIKHPNRSHGSSYNKPFVPEIFSAENLRHRFGVVQTAIIDGQAALFQLGIDIDKAFAKTHIAPRIILLGLHSGWNNRFDAHH